MAILLQYAERGRNAWWRYLVGVLVALILWMVIEVAAVVLLLVTRAMPADLAAELTHPDRPVVFFTMVAIGFGSLSVGFAAPAKLVHRKPGPDLLGASP